MATKSPQDVRVPIEFELVTVERDMLHASHHSGKTIGSHIDQMIDGCLSHGDRVGKFTIDFSDYSAAFVQEREPRGEV